MTTASIFPLALGVCLVVSQVACTTTSGNSQSVHFAYVKQGVPQSSYEAEFGACGPEGNAAASKVDAVNAPAGGGLGGGIAGGIGAGLIEATRRNNAYREAFSACMARKGYRKRDFAEDPTAQFPGMGNAQLRRLNAHIAAGNEPGTFVP